eukprot:scaffold2576_cov116-Cylindrotheca_fusiformis.AAC.8
MSCHSKVRTDTTEDSIQRESCSLVELSPSTVAHFDFIFIIVIGVRAVTRSNTVGKGESTASTTPNELCDDRRVGRSKNVRSGFSYNRYHG